MTDADLKVIEERANKATPGPWSPFPSCVLRGADWVVSNAPEGARGRIMSDADAEFIAGSRGDVPALIAEISRLRAKVAEQETLLVRMDLALMDGADEKLVKENERLMGLICRHPRQERPGDPETSLPCAWPRCAAGQPGEQFVCIVGPHHRGPSRFRGPDEPISQDPNPWTQAVRFLRMSWTVRETGLEYWQWQRQ